MPKFDPRSLDDDTFQPIGAHPTVRPNSKSKWPPTRVLGWVMAIGGLSVVLNIVSVIVVAALFDRIETKLTAVDTRLVDVEQWLSRERALRQKIDDGWADTQRRQKESDAALAKAKADLKSYNAAGGVTGEVVRDLNGKPGPS
jgi:hypothetical protein